LLWARNKALQLAMPLWGFFYGKDLPFWLAYKLILLKVALNQ